jgi:hypothetical protein
MQYLAEADLTVLLVSSALTPSDLYVSDELQAQLLRHRAGNTSVCLLLAEKFPWENTRMAGLPFLPPSGIALEEATATVLPLLWDQVENLLEDRLEQLLRDKIRAEARYREIVATADRAFEDWQTQPETLPDTLQWYELALRQYRPGFRPSAEVLERKVVICHREIEFRYYANAIESAFRAGDFRGTLYLSRHAQAITQRNDARIVFLVEQATQNLERARMEQKRLPFAEHIQRADGHFNRLEYLEAAKAYESALLFYENGFSPDQEHLRQKISLCLRENKAGLHLGLAERAESGYRLHKALEHLNDALMSEQPRILGKAASVRSRLEKERHLRRFRDERTGLWGFYDERDQVVAIPARYEAVYDFAEHLAAVQQNGVWGFIDVQGQVVVPFRYAFVSHFRNGLCQVMLNGHTENLTLEQLLDQGRLP